MYTYILYQKHYPNWFKHICLFNHTGFTKLETIKILLQKLGSMPTTPFMNDQIFNNLGTY